MPPLCTHLLPLIRCSSTLSTRLIAAGALRVGESRHQPTPFIFLVLPRAILLTGGTMPRVASMRHPHRSNPPSRPLHQLPRALLSLLGFLPVRTEPRSSVSANSGHPPPLAAACPFEPSRLKSRQPSGPVRPKASDLDPTDPIRLTRVKLEQPATFFQKNPCLFQKSTRQTA